jgi:hypothetical protein
MNPSRFSHTNETGGDRGDSRGLAAIFKVEAG